MIKSNNFTLTKIQASAILLHGSSFKIIERDELPVFLPDMVGFKIDEPRWLE